MNILKNDPLAQNQDMEMEFDFSLCHGPYDPYPISGSHQTTWDKNKTISVNEERSQVVWYTKPGS